MLFFKSSISVNMFDIATKYDLRQPCISRSPRRWNPLTHWGRVTLICVSNLTIIGSDNGMSPGRYQAIIWTNAGILLIGPWWTNFGEIFIDIQTFSFKKMHLEVSSGKWRPFCLASLCVNVNYINMECKLRKSTNVICLDEWNWNKFSWCVCVI